jgi:hypothetical protein
LPREQSATLHAAEKKAEKEEKEQCDREWELKKRNAPTLVCCALPLLCSVNSPPFWQATEEKAKKEALKPQRKAERKTVRLADERAAVVEVRRIGQYGADMQP